MSSEGSRAAITTPNQAVFLRSTHANGRGNRPSSAAARDTSAVTSVQPFRAPMPDTTATPAIARPAQEAWVNMVSNALTNGAGAVTSVLCATGPITTADTSR